MDEKGAFLAPIREALGYPGAEVGAAGECRRLFDRGDDSDIFDRITYRTHVEKQSLLKLMMENAVPLNLGVHPVRSFAAAARAIGDIVSAACPEFGDTRQIIQHDDNGIAHLQLWKKFACQAVTVHTTYQADMAVREKAIASYVGITAPRWAVADSATIVEITGPGRPRSTSLLPSVHIALLRIEHLLADLGEAYALLRKNPPQESVVFISGPSKTADIEAHMVHGAHGPREMHLVVIDERMTADRNYQGSGLFPAE